VFIVRRTRRHEVAASHVAAGRPAVVNVEVLLARKARRARRQLVPTDLELVGGTRRCAAQCARRSGRPTTNGASRTAGASRTLQAQAGARVGRREASGVARAEIDATYLSSSTCGGAAHRAGVGTRACVNRCGDSTTRQYKRGHGKRANRLFARHAPSSHFRARAREEVKRPAFNVLAERETSYNGGPSNTCN
jgi:hypothetical protein